MRTKASLSCRVNRMFPARKQTPSRQQPLPSRFSSFHARPLTMNVSSQLDLQSPSENSECEPNGNAQKSQMSEVATSDQVIADPISISSETVASTHVAESTPEAAATAGGRGRVAKLVPLPITRRWISETSTVARSSRLHGRISRG